MQCFFSRFYRVVLLSALGFGFGVAHAALPVTHWRLDNGATVYFVETHALPMVDVEVDVVAGSALEPTDKAGLAGMVAGLLDAGAGGRDERAIADAFADVGAVFDAGVDADRLSVSMRSLSSVDELGRATDLFADVLGRPDFPEAVFAREKARAITGLRESLTQPQGLAGRAFGPSMSGTHPYGRQVTEESLGALSRADLQAFHRQHFQSGGMVVSIVGDLDHAGAEALARAVLARVLVGDGATLALPPVALPAEGLERIAHPSAQAHILIGQPLLTRDDPDYYPLLVGNYILGGGGFVSRLTKEVREARGLAYSVYSSMAPYRQAGPFRIGLQTRGQQADEALGVVRKTLQGFLNEGPSEEELQGAKDFIVNGFGLRLDSNAKVLGYLAVLGFYHLPDDWLDTYPERVKTVTRAQVQDAFRRRIQPEHMVTVIVGGDGDVAAEAKP